MKLLRNIKCPALLTNRKGEIIEVNSSFKSFFCGKLKLQGMNIRSVIVNWPVDEKLLRHQFREIDFHLKNDKLDIKRPGLIIQFVQNRTRLFLGILQFNARPTATDPDKLLSQLMDTLPDSIYFKDLKSRFILVNKATILKLNKKSASELIGKTDFDLFTHEHANEAFQDEQKIIRSGVPIIDKIEKETYPDGKVTWTSTTKLPLRDRKERVIGTFGVSRDITERKRMELLQDSMFRISQIVNIADNFMLMIQKISNIILAAIPVNNVSVARFSENGEIAEQITIPLNSMDEQSFNNLVKYVYRNAQIMKLDSPEKFSEILETKDPRILPAFWLGFPLFNDDKVIGVFSISNTLSLPVLTDKEGEFLLFISEQIAGALRKINYTRELLEKNEQLRYLNANKDKFFSIIAHDLRNPFTGLIGLSELLAGSKYDLNEKETHEITDRLHKSIVHVYNLLEHLLTWSRIHRGGIVISFSQFNITDLIRQCVDLYQNIAESKKITFTIQSEPELQITSDESVLFVVLRNLINNAIKYSQVNGKIVIIVNNKSGFIEISVIDEGIGMEQQKLNSLFKIEETSSVPGTQNEQGTGLGLIISKEFLDKIGGTISVTSELRRGTTFTIQLPA